MHCYNSTQNLKIDGQAHCYFSENFLEPILKSKIDDIKEEIDRYDRKLVASLDSSNIGGPLKGISVRKIRNSIDKNLFTCKTCQLTFTSFTSLTRHKAEHVVNSNLSLFPIGNPTRNNSISHEALLCD